MRNCPSLDANEHGMLDRPPDIAADVRGDDKNARRPHQDLGDVDRPARRIPKIDPLGSAIASKSITDQDEAYDRGQSQQSPVWPLSNALDQRCTLRAHRHEHM